MHHSDHLIRSASPSRLGFNRHKINFIAKVARANQGQAGGGAPLRMAGNTQDNYTEAVANLFGVTGSPVSASRMVIRSGTEAFTLSHNCIAPE